MLELLMVASMISGTAVVESTRQEPSHAPATQRQREKDGIDRALERAAKENRRVLLVQRGAEPERAVALDAALKSANVAKELMYEYDVVRLEDQPRAKAFAADPAVLTFVVLDAGGKRLADAQPVAEGWITNDAGASKLDEAKLLAFLDEHQATYLEAAKVRDAALARAKSEGKLVFLHFGAPWCGWCHKLEGWMEREKVAPLLAKQFVDLKIDTDRMVGGGQMLAELRKAAGLKESGGIPWFVFLDGDGKVLVTSEGPKGNVGFPYEPDEIAHFASMLESTRTKLAPEDVAALREELAASRREDEARRKKDAGSAK
jgi:thiol-disulfide isomerase/thioredoxin